MPKSLVLGNGSILIGIDKFAQVGDFYFPYVGSENQTSGRFRHKIGAYVDDEFSWFDDGTWDINIDSEKDTLAGLVHAENKRLGILVEFRCLVYNEKNIFIRQVTLTNKQPRPRRFKMFFQQVFELYESHRGDTAYYNPDLQALVHYKGRRVIIVNARHDGKGFDDYSVGLFNIEGKEGTYKDAEDGLLQKCGIEHGKVDSVLGMTVDCGADEARTFYYWICAEKTFREAKDLNTYVLEKTPQYLMRTTQDFWHAWIYRKEFDFCGLDQHLIDLFHKSLLIMRTQVDNGGSILASGDADMLQYGRDTYGYMWPRDASFVAISLAKVGDLSVAKKFFKFCNTIIEKDGYFLHKYRPDASLGSSWHPWVKNGVTQLPIQEDETALVIYALWEYYEMSRDLEFIEEVYNSLIKKAAHFMVDFVDQETGLPKPSYDLWEENMGVHTFTCGTVYGALMAAAKFAKLLGKHESYHLYTDTAERMKDAIIKYLYDDEKKCFVRTMSIHNGEMVYDRTVDMSSVYAMYTFGILEPDDPRMEASMHTALGKLTCPTSVGGIGRYEGDVYCSIGAKIPGNPWFITSLWHAQYQIVTAKSRSELEEVKSWLEWVYHHSLASGILSEQLNPLSGEQISVAPLTWSHGEYVITVLKYIEKCKQLN